MSSSEPEPQVKGVAFRTIAFCFGELHGEPALNAAQRAMPAELADAFRYGTLLAASWYPIAWYRATFHAFRKATGLGVELPRTIGKLAARHDMSGVHKRILASLVSPQALVSMSQRVFNTYYDTGTARVLESRRGFIRVSFEGCRGWDENMWSELAGSCESLLEIAGAKHVRLRMLTGGADGPNAEFDAHWS